MRRIPVAWSAAAELYGNRIVAMKILHVCHEPLPSHHTNTEQTVRTAAALATEGAQVDLLCPVPSQRPPSGWERIATFYGIAKEAGNGLRLIELPGPGLCRGPAIKPWLDFAAGGFGCNEGYDFHLVRDPLALVAALRAGRRTVFDSYRYDLHSQLHFWPWRAYCYRHPKLAGIIAHSEIARQALLRAGVVPDSTLLAHNGADPRIMEPRMSKADARRRLGISRDRSIVVYTGRMGREKGTDSILALAGAVPEVEFVMVGHIPGSVPSVRLARRVSALGLENLRLVERVPPAAVAPYLLAADCLLVPLSAAPLQRHKRTVLPLKIFLYMAAGRPILAPRTPDVAEVLRDEHSALLVEPDNVTTAVQVLRRLLEDPGLQDRLAQNALAESANHSWTVRARKIVEFLRTRM